MMKEEMLGVLKAERSKLKGISSVLYLSYDLLLTTYPLRLNKSKYFFRKNHLQLPSVLFKNVKL